MQGAVILHCLFSKPSSFISCNLGRLWKLFIKHLTARVTWGMKVLFPWQNTCFCLLKVEDLVIFHGVSNWRSKMFCDVEASPIKNEQFLRVTSWRVKVTLDQSTRGPAVFISRCKHKHKHAQFVIGPVNTLWFLLVISGNWQEEKPFKMDVIVFLEPWIVSMSDWRLPGCQLMTLCTTIPLVRRTKTK